MLKNIQETKKWNIIMLTSNLSLKTMLKFLPGPQDVEKEILSSEKVNIYS